MRYSDRAGRGRSNLRRGSTSNRAIARGVVKRFRDARFFSKLSSLRSGGSNNNERWNEMTRPDALSIPRRLGLLAVTLTLAFSVFNFSTRAWSINGNIRVDGG